MSDERHVGFIGLGAMGTPMVRRLATTGHKVTGFDIDRARLRGVAADGLIHPAESLAEFEDLGLVICMLPNSDVVDTVVAGQGGLLATLRPGALIVDMGSSVPSRTQALARLAGAQSVELIDAPVSGGTGRAATGDLSIMVGGATEQVARARPTLESLGSTIRHVGPVGSGHALKCLNNVMSAMGLTIACEVVAVGRAFGLDPAVMIDVINQSTGRNHATEHKMHQFVLAGRHESGFLLDLMVKDLRTASALARDLGVRTPVADSLLAVWTAALDQLPRGADQTAISKLYGEFDTTTTDGSMI